MPNPGKYTHALVSRVPKSYQSLTTNDGSCIDFDRAKSQQEHLVQCLRSLNIDVLELPPDEESPASVFVNDCAIILQGIALMCRLDESRKRDVDTVRAVLRKELGIIVEELDSENAQLNGSDVLFTGKEFFVGIGQETNVKGALNVARTWPEYPCTPIQMEGGSHLRDRITSAGGEILSVSSSPYSRSLLKKIEREATHGYKTLTVPEEEAANCLYVNGTLIHIASSECSKSSQVFSERVSFPRMEVSVSEFQKLGRGLTSICLMIRHTKTIRAI